MHRSFLLSLVLSPLLHAAAPDWENPAVFQRNRLPAQATSMPFPDRAAALANPRPASAWCQSLNSSWKFHYSGSLSEVPAGFEKPEFDAGAWKEIPVPSNWQLQGYGIPLYSGSIYPFANNPPMVTDEPPANYTNHPAENRHPIGSYRRTFNLPADWQQRRTIIAFEGVDSAFDLWVNGGKAGYSEDSRTTARFDITALVKPGVNTVAVQVHQYSDGSYLESQDTWKLSGIYRDVYLVSSPQVELADHFLKADLTADGKGALNLNATLKNHETSPRKGRFMIELVDAANQQIAFKEGTYDLAPGVEASIPLAAADLAIEGWSAEKPTLYRYVLTLADENGKPLACFSGKTGFRRDEIKDGRFLHNGQPILFKGVIRHDHSPRGGHTVTEAELRTELLMMKQANLNAIRTDHIPPDPLFLDLCDELGFYVLNETNLETSPEASSLKKDPAWQEAILDRVKNLVERDKNHPSVIAWSTGIPSELLTDRSASLSWLLSRDSSRPIADSGGNGKETFLTLDWPSLEQCAATKAPQGPMVVNAYSRAFGNSSGELQAYWEIFRKSPRLQGGFMANWRDEILFKKQASDPDKPGILRIRLIYGGDSGDQPNAGSTCVSGVTPAIPAPTPTFEEVKKIHQDIHTSLVDGSGSDVKIRIGNSRFFTSTSEVKGSWKLLKDGKDIAQGGLPSVDIAPRQEQEVTIATKATPDPKAEFILRVRYDLKDDNAWYPAGMPIAWEELPLSWGKRQAPSPQQTEAKTTFTTEGNLIRIIAGEFYATFDQSNGQVVSLKRKDEEILLSPLRLDFWRVPTSTDRLHAFDQKLAIWREAGAKTTASNVRVSQAGNDVLVNADLTIPAGGSTAKLSYRFTGAGEIAGDVVFIPDPKQPDLPRVGLTCAIPPSISNWTWHGKGPHENYVDRNQGAWTTIHTGLVSALFQRYPVPQEAGNRTGVRWSAFSNPAGGTGLRIDAMGDSLLEVSAMPGSPAEYETARHFSELSRPDRITLHFDHRQMGVGSADAPDRVLPSYARLTTENPYHWSFVLSIPQTAPLIQSSPGALQHIPQIPAPIPNRPPAGLPISPVPPGTPVPPAKPHPASDD